MNRIVILGNGFDMAHNLPTGYRDFIDFLREDFVRFANSASRDQLVNGHELFYFASAESYQPNGSQARRVVFKPGTSEQSWEDLNENSSIEFTDGAMYKTQISFRNK
jgi:hypothetical protein